MSSQIWNVKSAHFAGAVFDFFLLALCCFITHTEEHFFFSIKYSECGEGEYCIGVGCNSGTMPLVAGGSGVFEAVQRGDGEQVALLIQRDRTILGQRGGSFRQLCESDLCVIFGKLC